MAATRYNVGDTVLVRIDLGSMEKYGDVTFVPSMQELCDKLCIVETRTAKGYRLKGDPHLWTDEMLTDPPYRSCRIMKTPPLMCNIPPLESEAKKDERLISFKTKKIEFKFL